MSAKGMGVAHAVGIVMLLVVTAILAILYLRDAESAVAAKKTAERTLEDVREIIDTQTSAHQRAIEDTRSGLDLPDPYSADPDLSPR